MQWNRAYPFKFDRKSMETETTTQSEFHNNKGKAIAEQILASEERKKSKGAGLLKLQSGIRAGS